MRIKTHTSCRIRSGVVIIFLRESPNFLPSLKVGASLKFLERGAGVEVEGFKRSMELHISQSLNNTFVHPVSVDRCVSSTDRHAQPRGPGYVPSGGGVIRELCRVFICSAPLPGGFQDKVANETRRCIDTWSFGWNFTAVLFLKRGIWLAGPRLSSQMQLSEFAT